MRKRLLDLYAANRAVEGPRGLRAERGDEEATLYVYDVIVDSQLEAEWFGGVAPEAFAKTLAEIDADTIHLRINSPGGSVFAARAMEQAIREHKAKVVAHIDGYAASAASVLMLAADEIVAAPGSMVMIHNAWGISMGNADEMRSYADLLDKVDGTIAASYAARTGRSLEQIESWMSAETWFTAAEAMDAGFVNRVVDDKAPAALAWNVAALGGMSLSDFNKLSARLRASEDKVTQLTVAAAEQEQRRRRLQLLDFSA